MAGVPLRRGSAPRRLNRRLARPLAATCDKAEGVSPSKPSAASIALALKSRPFAASRQTNGWRPEPLWLRFPTRRRSVPDSHPTERRRRYQRAPLT